MAAHPLKILFTLSFLCFLKIESLAQSYTSYFTGDAADVNTTVQKGTVLMGGATENDNAMRWFLNHSGGGDIVVLRTSGSNGYNDYLYSTLGVEVNSVESIVCNSPSASYDPYVIQQVANAEALWFAGGNQWNYISYWNNTPLDSVFNYLINVKHIPVGGTSAGMAIMGHIVYTAQNGSITSASALADPYNTSVTLLHNDFLNNSWLNNVITDTHYDNPDRRGRHICFMARAAQDYGIPVFGIACEEYTAVCIDSNGNASVYGNYPTGNDYAYFLQTNCVQPNSPELCAAGQPLNWNRNQQAVKVYKVAGTQTGNNTFKLSDWKTGSGGVWQNWYVTNGTLQVVDNAAAPACTVANVPNNVSLCAPAANGIVLISDITGNTYQWQLDNGTGFYNINNNVNYTGATTNTLSLSNIPSSWYGYTYRCVVNGLNNSSTASLRFTNTWTGTINTDWGNAGNWQCNAIPDIYTDVQIGNGATVIISSNAVCRSLQLAATANLTAKNGYSLIIAH
jgi:cyanophycinase-like exopeptidase